MSYMSYNEAAFFDGKERDQIDDILLRFERKTDIPLKIEISRFKSGDLYDPSLDGKQIGYIINGNEFRKEPCVESWNGYVNRIKSYLFNILIA